MTVKMADIASSGWTEVYRCVLAAPAPEYALTLLVFRQSPGRYRLRRAWPDVAGWALTPTGRLRAWRSESGAVRAAASEARRYREALRQSAAIRAILEGLP